MILRQRRMRALRRHDWVVYAKTPLAGPAAVLDYLARYTHRTAIGNERLVGIDAGKVRLRVRGDENGARRTIALDGAQFIGRLLQHVLPSGFKRIRHYGLLAPATKADRLRRARQLLAMPAANPQACEDAQAFMRRVAAIDIDCCPHCSIGRWRVLQHVAADQDGADLDRHADRVSGAPLMGAGTRLSLARSRRRRRPGPYRVCFAITRHRATRRGGKLDSERHSKTTSSNPHRYRVRLQHDGIASAHRRNLHCP